MLLNRRQPEQDVGRLVCAPLGLLVPPTPRFKASYSSAPVTKAATAARSSPDHPKAVHSLASEPTVTETKTSFSSAASSTSLSQSLNPPASTRPPPLTVPVREPNSSLPKHLYKLGKAYVSFYRTGLKAILTNYRLLSKTSKNAETSRAALLLRERTRHDIVRLPLFGLIILLTGEFSPLVVFLFPKLTPYTCRIPGHVNKLRRKAEERRARSAEGLAKVKDGMVPERVADGHIARVLGLGGSVWDRVGLRVPFARRRVRGALERIVRDDFMIKAGGGVGKVDDDEVVLAAEVRGLDVREREVSELRDWLGRWIDRTTRGGESEGQGAVRKLLLETK